MQRCPTCQSEQPDGARFCSNCGASLLQRTTSHTERKTVTVLFADLVNFTSRSEALDVEDVRAELEVYHEQVRTTLERFGGTVEKFVGDAVMAVFGAPVSHEDDAERAVRAALALKDVMAELNEAEGFDLHIRVGVNTGEALVSLDARPELGESMVAGDVVNTASRLETAAPVDGTVVGELTHALTERVIEYGEPQQLVLKGKALPQTVRPALDTRANVGRDVAPPAGAFVGRSRELRVITDALMRVEVEGRAQLLTIIGQPGMGKTRLVAELYALAGASASLIAWRQGASRAYGQGRAFGALSEIVRAECGLLDNDDAEAAEGKLKAAVEAVIEDSEERQRLKADLRPLLGLSGTPGGPGNPRRSWTRFLEAMAERRTTVLVLEDLHWADDALLDFVDELFETVAEVPLLVVATARPELLARRPMWGGGKVNAFTMSLAPLPDQDSAKLLGQLLNTSVMVAERQAELLDKIGGNPLYAEEYARLISTATSDGTDLDGLLPASIQGIIAARIDALPGPAKAVLCDGGVVGKVFWRDAVQQIGGLQEADLTDALRVLERREFIRREPRSAVAGDTQYVFRHLLVRDVAYSLIPRSERARKHWKAVEWLEGLSADRASEQAELIADHLFAAWQLAGASKQAWADLLPRTREALIRAGDQAFRLQSYLAADERYTQALALFDSDDPAQAETLHQWIRNRRRVGRETLDDLLGARDKALRIGSPEVAAQIEAYLGFRYYERGEPDRGREFDFAAAARLRDRPPSRAKAAVLSNLAGTLVSGGEDAEAIQTAQEAMDILGAGPHDDDVFVNDLYRVIGMAKLHIGDPDGLVQFQRAVDMAVEHDSSKQAEALHSLMEARVCLGELAEAEQLAAEGRSLAERYGLVAPLAMFVHDQVHSYYWSGDWSAALQAAEQLITDPDTATHYMTPLTLGVRARIRLARGELSAACSDATDALSRAEGAEREILWPSIAVAARVFAYAGRTTEARARMSELATLLRAQSAPLLSGEEWWATDLAFAAAELGDVAALHHFGHADPGRLSRRWLAAAKAVVGGSFSEAITRYDEIGSVPDAALARLVAAESDRSSEELSLDAGAELETALATFRELGAAGLTARAQRTGRISA